MCKTNNFFKIFGLMDQGHHSLYPATLLLKKVRVLTLGLWTLDLVLTTVNYNSNVVIFVYYIRKYI